MRAPFPLLLLLFERPSASPSTTRADRLPGSVLLLPVNVTGQETKKEGDEKYIKEQSKFHLTRWGRKGFAGKKVPTIQMTDKGPQ